MTRRRWILNGALAAALVGALVVAITSVGSPASGTTSTTRTATASTGTVTATVSASGNVSASDSVGVNFQGSGGTVTAIYVKVGERVHKGEPLAKVDDTSARQGLQSARASLAAAEAGYATTTAGQTSAERQRDEVSISSAEVSLQNAQTALTQAKQSYSLDERQQDALVAAALKAYQQAGASEKASARTALINARNTRASTLLRDNQAIESAQGQVSAAEVALQSARANAAVDAQPPTSGTVAQAQAQVASARIQVNEARTTLAQTTLRAPVAGTVTSISGAVGEDSSASSQSSSSSSGTSSSSSSTTASGFVVIQGIRDLQVTSMVAEADAAKVKVGQSATVTFSALDRTARGRVTSIALQDTVSNNVVEYAVTVTLGGHTDHIRLGQTASVSIVTGVARDVLTVPSSSVTTVGTSSTVTVLANGVRTVRSVQVGLIGDTTTQITSGLNEGDVVVLPTGSGSSSGFTFPGGGLPGGGIGGGLGG
jgi:HlyD family secretion protein